MLLLLHGAAGSWDELAIAVAAIAVLWIAVKLAGRKSANDEDDGELDPELELRAEGDSEEQQRPARRSPTKLG
jgi:hypothetical protein